MCQEVKEACFCLCSGGVPRGSSSSFSSPNESVPSALGGAVGWEVRGLDAQRVRVQAVPGEEKGRRRHLATRRA